MRKRSSEMMLATLGAALWMAGSTIHDVSGVPQLQRDRWKAMNRTGKHKERHRRRSVAQRYHQRAGKGR